MIKQLHQSLRQFVERDKLGDPRANALVTRSTDNNTELGRTNELVDARISDALDEADDIFWTA